MTRPRKIKERSRDVIYRKEVDDLLNKVMTPELKETIEKAREETKKRNALYAKRQRENYSPEVKEMQKRRLKIRKRRERLQQSYSRLKSRINDSISDIDGEIKCLLRLKESLEGEQDKHYELLKKLYTGFKDDVDGDK